MSQPRPGWWWPALGCVLVSGGMFLLALTWRLHVEAAEGLHLTALALRRTRAMAIAMPMLPALGLLGLAIARRIEWRGVVSLVAVLVLSLVGCGFLLLGPFELFHTETLDLSVVSPDGERQADLFRVDGLLTCSRTVYVAERGATYAGVAVVGGSMDCERPGAPEVQWLADGGVALSVDGGTAPKPLNLFFGPK